MNKARIAAVYQYWHSFLATFSLSSSPALLLETIIAAVDQGHGDTDKLGLVQLCTETLFIYLISFFVIASREL